MICGNYFTSESLGITKFTKALSDVVGFTSSFIPANGLNSNTIRLQWNDSNEESYYALERKVNAGTWETPILINNPTNQSVITYDDTNSIDVTINKYYYRIKAVEVVVS